MLTSACSNLSMISVGRAFVAAFSDVTTLAPENALFLLFSCAKLLFYQHILTYIDVGIGARNNTNNKNPKFNFRDIDDFRLQAPLTDDDIAKLAKVVSSQSLWDIALEYLELQNEELKTLEESCREDKVKLKREILFTWRSRTTSVCPRAVRLRYSVLLWSF